MKDEAINSKLTESLEATEDLKFMHSWLCV